MKISYMISGMNRNGSEVFSQRFDDVVSSTGVMKVDLNQLASEHPEAIRINITVAVPDPQVLKIKRQITDIVANGISSKAPIETIADVLFDSFNIKGL